MKLVLKGQIADVLQSKFLCDHVELLIQKYMSESILGDSLCLKCCQDVR